MSLENTGKPFIISRTFDAPRERVWRAWSNAPDMRWLGPKGVAIRHATFDFHPGGTLHYGIKTPDGKEMWGKWVIREIRPPELLVYLNSFSDAEGGVSRHPMSPDWPMQLLSTIRFTEEGAKTTVTIEWLPFEASESEVRTFDASHESMRMGWGGSLDRLAEHLANPSAEGSQDGR